MRIFIYDSFPVIDKKSLFILVRPFFSGSGWGLDSSGTIDWKLKSDIRITDEIHQADFLLIAHPINTYLANHKIDELNQINSLCVSQSIIGYGFISGDFGQAYPEFSHLKYFRMGGFTSQLSDKNLGLPVSLSDHFQRLYQLEDPLIRDKPKRPIIGFCGHATASLSKRIFENLKFIKENVKRFAVSPLRTDYEPLFASAYQRWKLLQDLSADSDLECQFVYREKYRGGALNQLEREKTTQEYYDNMYHSDYILCLRGAGNFSVRLYETLMMGKIPIFVNTDCLLPFENHIDWRKHVVWVEWKDRKNIANCVKAFHDSLSNTEFREIQKRNRDLWKNELSVGGMLTMLASDF